MKLKLRYTKNIKVHEKSIKKLKGKLKLLTSRSKVGNIEVTYKKIKQLVVGWVNYSKLADMKSAMRKLDEWLRGRIQMCYW